MASELFVPGKCSLAYCSQAFAGLPTFWPMTFHLLFSYSLMAFIKAMLCQWQVSMRVAKKFAVKSGRAVVRTSSSANSA